VSQIEAAGFPPPPPGDNTQALATWNQAVADAKNYSTPQPICANGTATFANCQGIWAGHIVPNSVNDNIEYDWIQSTWVQPSVSGITGDTNFRDTPGVAFWAGIGANNIIQAGVLSSSTAQPDYHFWTEDLPQTPVYEGPVIGPGDTAYVHILYEAQGETEYWLEYETTGNYQIFNNATPYDGYASAEFIAERCGPYSLPQFAQEPVTGDDYGNGNYTFPLTTDNQIAIMTSSCLSTGAVLSQPGGVDGSGNFNQNWDQGSPVCNS
jgi:hypothetical protein